MMNIFYYALIPGLPLLAFLINITLGRKFIRDKAHLVSIPLLSASWLIAMWTVIQVLRGHTFDGDLYTWVASGGFKVSVGFLIDQLTAAMLVVVTTVGLLVHIYSAGYMHGDKGFYRFYAYLGLFVFSMLMLIMSNNFLQIYFGWEGVGLCSYFLIGFWYEKKSASDAGKKAFIVNRFGDFGFGLGIMLIFLTFGSLHYGTVFSAAPGILSGKTISFFGHPVGLATVIALLLFCGAVGKSAQFPLHVWLPDAMEGPTPVSALIHAATMVTAGVFMISRCSPIFNLSHTAMDVVAVTGAFTALFAATIALTQNDIKRVIAYSTVSQLGYMVLACGVGAYGAGIFHLFTHGFFKALLFLCAGSVMHAMSGELDIWKMGGLKKYMPITYITFLLASISISGIPPFAGFFSKDEILGMAFASGPLGKVLWAAGAFTAMLTAFYSFRVVFVAFHGKFRGTHEQEHHLHESPRSMTIPLLVLAVGAVAAGWIGIPSSISGLFGLGHINFIGSFLGKVVGAPHVAEQAASTDYMPMGASVALGLLGVLLAAYMYIWNPELPGMLARVFRPAYLVSWNKYYVDELYDFAVVRPTLWVARSVIVGVTDGKWIEGVVNGVPQAIGRVGQTLRKIQSGVLQDYADVMAFGVFAFVAVILLAFMKK